MSNTNPDAGDGGDKITTVQGISTSAASRTTDTASETVPEIIGFGAETAMRCTINIAMQIMGTTTKKNEN